MITNYLEEIKRLNALLVEKRISFSPEDYLYLSGKSSPRGKLVHFMTQGYYQREQLWRTGRLVWSYVFKSFDDHPDNGRPFPSWVLFSPELKCEEHPELLTEVHAKLQSLVDQPTLSKEYRKLAIALKEPISEPIYMEIPEAFSNGHLVYLSMVLVYPEHFMEFTFGFKPLIINPEITKETMFLPAEYIS